MNPQKWPIEKTNLFIEMYSRGDSAIVIAQEFGLKINGVKSKAHRLGVKRPVNIREPKLPKSMDVIYKPEIHVKTLLELGARQCHFIVGDPKVDHGYCGLPVFKGDYCKSCFDVIYRKVA